MSGMKPSNVIRIPCTMDSIFRYWLQFLTPFHHLTTREQDVAVAFLKRRYELSKMILDKELLERTLMNEDAQKEIRQSCNVPYQYFQAIKSSLKAKKFFVDKRINPKLIPDIKEEDGNFQLLLLFEINK
jgi:hypothetical protein